MNPFNVPLPRQPGFATIRGYGIREDFILNVRYRFILHHPPSIKIRAYSRLWNVLNAPDHASQRFELVVFIREDFKLNE